jgi:hypothetical protein
LRSMEQTTAGSAHARANRPRLRPPCVVWVDRHVHKNGGTTIRGLMTKLVSIGVSTHIFGWAHSHRHWVQLLSSLSNFTSCHAMPTSLITLELHDGIGRDFERDWLPHLRAFRANASRSCCKVVLTTRVRRPAEFYVSMFRWGVEPVHTADFRQWAPQNLQSVLQLQGPYKQWREGNLNKAAEAWFDKYGAAEHARARGMLARDYDVAWPIEHFDAGLSILAERCLGLNGTVLSRSYQLRVPALGLTGGGLQGQNKANAIARDSRLCNASECERLVGQLAPFDRMLYDAAAARFEDAVAKSSLPQVGHSAQSSEERLCLCNVAGRAGLRASPIDGNGTAGDLVRAIASIFPGSKFGGYPILRSTPPEEVHRHFCTCGRVDKVKNTPG